jgi:hypothetical protein
MYMTHKKEKKINDRLRIIWKKKNRRTKSYRSHPASESKGLLAGVPGTPELGTTLQVACAFDQNLVSLSHGDTHSWADHFLDQTICDDLCHYVLENITGKMRILEDESKNIHV